jgi:soluble lytic murein transglycosylase-like protein
MEIANELAAVARRVREIERGLEPAGSDFGRLVGASAATIDAVPEPLAETDLSRGRIERLVDDSAQRYGVDPALIDAIILNESGFNPNATSSAGAKGLMQLMPETAASLGVGDAYDAAQNIRGGTRYLRSLLDRFGEVELAVAAYNAGPNAVERYGGVPPYAQTRRYVRNVVAAYRAHSQVGNLPTNAGSQQARIIKP